MNVPGLTGRWQDRNRQLYEKLGSPLGAYNAGYDHNMFLLNNIRQNGFYQNTPLPGSAPPPQPAAPPPPTPQQQAKDLASKVPIPEDFDKLEGLRWSDLYDEETAKLGSLQEASKYYDPIESRGLEDIGSDFAQRGLYRGGQRTGKQGLYSQNILSESEKMQAQLTGNKRGEVQDYRAAMRGIYDEDPFGFKKVKFQDWVNQYNN